MKYFYIFGYDINFECFSDGVYVDIKKFIWCICTIVLFLYVWVCIIYFEVI